MTDYKDLLVPPFGAFPCDKSLAETLEAAYKRNTGIASDEGWRAIIFEIGRHCCRVAALQQEEILERLDRIEGPATPTGVLRMASRLYEAQLGGPIVATIGWCCAELEAYQERRPALMGRTMEAIWLGASQRWGVALPDDPAAVEPPIGNGPLSYERSLLVSAAWARLRGQAAVAKTDQLVAQFELGSY